MARTEAKSGANSRTCDLCGANFPSYDALELHTESSHAKRAKPDPEQEEALSFAPGGTVADFEDGPRPGGKMDRETSRPAKRWESPGEEGEPRKGQRNQGAPPIEVPDPVAEASLSEHPVEPSTGSATSSTGRRRKSKETESQVT